MQSSNIKSQYQVYNQALSRNIKYSNSKLASLISLSSWSHVKFSPLTQPPHLPEIAVPVPPLPPHKEHHQSLVPLPLQRRFGTRTAEGLHSSP